MSQPTIAVFLEGGLVQGIVTDDKELSSKLRVIIVDFDTEWLDTDVVRYQPPDGEPTRAWISESEPELNPTVILEAHRAHGRRASEQWWSEADDKDREQWYERWREGLSHK